MSKILKKLNHYMEFKTKEGIKSVVDFIQSNHTVYPEGLNERQRRAFHARYATDDFITKPIKRKRTLFYRPNPDVLIEVIRPEDKPKKIKEIYDNLKQGLGTGLLAFYHMVASHYLPITKEETTEFLRKQGDWLINRQPHDVVNKPILAEVPNERWGMDITFLNRYPSNINGGYIYLLVCIDYFSGKVWARALKTRTNDAPHHEILDAFKSICDEANTRPHIMQSDHEFTKGELAVWCASHGITQYKTTSYSPVSNGKVERMNRTIRGKVKSIVARTNKLEWYKYLDDILENINNQQTARTGYSANQLWRQGYHPQVNPPAPVVPVNDHMSREELVSHNVNVNERRAIAQSSKTPERFFNVGDLVRVRMTKFQSNNVYRKAKETGIGWSYVGVHYTPEVFRVATAHHYDKLTSPKRDTYYIEKLNGDPMYSSRTASVPMQFFGNDLLRVPANRKATHIVPTKGEAGINQANYLNRLIKKKPKGRKPKPPHEPPHESTDEAEPPQAEPPRRTMRTTEPVTTTPPTPRTSVVDDSRIRYIQNNPKRVNSSSYERYEHYKHARTITEALELGATRGDVKWDLSHGYISRL